MDEGFPVGAYTGFVVTLVLDGLLFIVLGSTDGGLLVAPVFYAFGGAFTAITERNLSLGMCPECEEWDQWRDAVLPSGIEAAQCSECGFVDIDRWL